MATNLRGASRTKIFLLLHTEKIAIGLVGVLTLMIVYKSFSLPRLDDKHQPNALQREITQTHHEIESFTWNKAVADYPDEVRNAQTITVTDNFNVDAQAYVNGGDANGKTLSSFDPVVIAPMITRADPPVLNAIDICATGGTGMFAFVDEEVRKQRQLQLAIETAEIAKKEEERAQMEQAAWPGGRRRRLEGRSAEASNQLYDPDHPKRRLIDASLRMKGVSLQGDERVERAYWACVVAKVPIREQLKRFQDAFEKARGYDLGNDFPEYLGFFVERAEVLPGRNLEWQRVPLYDGQKKSIAANSPLTTGPNHGISMLVIDKLYAAAARFWAGGGSLEVVDERYMERALTLPLPPLVGRDWSSEATHPDITLNPPPLEEETISLAADLTEQQAVSTDVNSGFGTANSAMQAGPSQLGRAGYSAWRMGSTGMRPERYGPGSRRSAGGFGVSYQGRVGTGRTAAEYTALPKGVNYHLLRFFDYTVEPGKKYKYRVKIVIADPNYNMPTRTLAPAVLERQKRSAKANNGRRRSFRIAEAWSDPSPTVGIPIGGRVRLVNVKVPSSNKFNDEPSVGLLIETFALDERGNAMQASIEENGFRRGDVVNLVKDTEYVGPGYIDTQEKFPFLTGMTLLDIDGGTKLTPSMSVPARILLMGPAGQLYIRNQLDDEQFVERHRLLFAKPNSQNRRSGA